LNINTEYKWTTVKKVLLVVKIYHKFRGSKSPVFGGSLPIFVLFLACLLTSRFCPINSRFLTSLWPKIKFSYLGQYLSNLHATKTVFIQLWGGKPISYVHFRQECIILELWEVQISKIFRQKVIKNNTSPTVRGVREGLPTFAWQCREISLHLWLPTWSLCWSK